MSWLKLLTYFSKLQLYSTGEKGSSRLKPLK